MTEIIKPPFTVMEANDWEQELEVRTNELRVHLDVGYEREVWKTLGYSSWNEYLNIVADKYGLSDRHMRRLDFANRTQKMLGPIGPSPESHLRPLSQLSSDNDKQKAWQQVVDTAPNGKVTEIHVRKVVDEYKEVKEEVKQSKKSKSYITLTEWQDGQRWNGQPVTSQMNKVNENIEWAAFSWNPITGCLHNCAYCYARDIANRFYDQKFEPSFIPERLEQPDNTKSIESRWEGDIFNTNVFTCSMADLFGKWVPEDWIKAVLDAINRNPQWTFLLLTKFPIRMAEFEYPDNVWLGTTVDYQWAVERAEKAFIKIKASGFNGICWLSCEPMMEKLSFSSLDMFDWVVMGGSSKSTQTDEFRPPFEWIVNLHNQAREANCKVYQKTNLIPGMSDRQRIREYPIKE